MLGINVNEHELALNAPELLDLLLIDKSTGKNIVWATEDYQHLGPEYEPGRQITPRAITGPSNGVIRPRAQKSKTNRWDRTKGRAEVFTASWLCNEQNNAIDFAWFGRDDVFNTAGHQSWKPTSDPVKFEPKGRRTWQRYVDERRMEVACGEAPYIVSRYDAESGEPIPVNARVGLLDRKLRVVGENTSTVDDWRKWARRAFESVYAFEYQGDSLLLARENLLATYGDYLRHAWNEEPSDRELAAIANVISWNVWQMDAFTQSTPVTAQGATPDQLDIFGEMAPKATPCVVRDWRAKKTVEYREIASSAEEQM